MSGSRDRLGPYLAIDTGSAVTSLALALATGECRSLSCPQQESSKALLPMIQQLLVEAGLEVKDLSGLVALQGPGSFTGLRIGLATLLGLHQATGVPACAIPSLAVLASLAEPPAKPLGPVLAAIDARRGNWFTQLYRQSEESLPQALGEPHWGPPAEHPLHEAATVVGFGAAQLAELGVAAPGLKILEPEPLAAAAARLAPRLPHPWQSSTLSHPLYLLPPSVSRPRP